MSTDKDAMEIVEEIVEEVEGEELRERVQRAMGELKGEAPRREVEQVPVMVEVREDYEHWVVDLVLGKMEVHMDVAQARNLALQLRQAANRLERAALERGRKHKDL